MTVPGINEAFFEPAYFLQLLTNGLTNGAIYALMALCVVMIYRTTGHLNFAQGEMGTLGAFVVYVLAVEQGLPLWVGIKTYAAWLATQDVSAINERVEAAWQELREKGLVS